MENRIIIDKFGDPCIQPMNDKAIRDLSKLKSPKHVRRLVGAVNYVSGFLPNIQAISRPLHQLTRKKNKFVWTDEHEQVFEKIKELYDD